MCPLWPLHIILLYVLCVAPLLLMAQHIHVAKPQQQPKQLKVAFGPEMSEKITEGKTKMIEFQIANMEDFDDRGSLEVEVTTTDPHIASVQYMGDSKDFSPNTNWTGSFNLTARFLGYTKVVVRLWGNISIGRDAGKDLIAQSEPGKVAVVRAARAIDKAFIYTIAILVSVAFINMGCMLDLEIVKATLKKPIGPAIGFCCQYIFMPLCAFGLAKLFLANNIALQLGLFVTGCSPGGGGSNLWTYILGGNLHLSITMTFLSTLAAFAMMPFWTMTLGRLIFAEGHIVVPYRNIATLAGGLVVPLMIGLAIRRFFPKVATVLARALKPLAGLFICVIVGFGVYANLYMLQLLDGMVLLSATCLVLLGYTFGGMAATIMRQSWPDALTIAVETGIQNTGIAIFILRVTLEQPEADINTVVPVAVAIMTPVPLFILWVLQKCVFSRFGYCVVKNPEEKIVCPVACIEDGLEQNNSASVEKLLPNNNDMPVNVNELAVK